MKRGMVEQGKVRVGIVVVVIALFGLGFALTSAVAQGGLAWPTDRGARVITYHGDNWIENGCDGQRKRHVGIDIGVGRGRPVYAAESGVVVMYLYDGRWKGMLTIEHRPWRAQWYTTNYWHIVTNLRIGARVQRGQPIGVVADMGNNSHLHFGLRYRGYSNVANRGALPRSRSCGPSDPKWPEYTLNPLDYTRP